MKISFVTGGLYSHASGIARILSELANSLLEADHQVSIHTTVCDGRTVDTSMLKDPKICTTRPGRWMGRLSFSPELRKVMEQELPTADIIHNHSMWMMPNHYASRIAKRSDIPLVFTAYGYLEEWALSHSRWKKRVAGAWFQDQDLNDATCIHVNSLSEVDSIRKYGLRNPVAVIPNGIMIESPAPQDAVDSFRQEYGIPEKSRVLLFMSRLHKKKGLHHLIRAWSTLCAEYPDWHLVIAGPDDGAEKDIKTLADDCDVNARLSFTGLIQDMHKRAALTTADCFVLPSFSEGFSSAVLEAMSMNCPALITPGCNFPEAQSAQAAIIIEPNEAGTVTGLRQMMDMTNSDRQAMGQSARELVMDHYCWSSISSRMEELYSWMQSGGASPPFVIT